MLTVSAILFVVIGVGLVTTTWWGGSTSVMVRSGIWLGWFWVAVYVSVAHLFFAMQPPVAIPIFIASSIGWLLLTRHLLRVRRLRSSKRESATKRELTNGRLARPRWHYVVWALAFALFALLSNQVLRAPIYHSDAGIYRIPYSLLTAQYPEIPGIANLNPEFGFGHLTDTVSGLIGSLLTVNEGYRFIGVLLMTGLVMENVMRLTKSKAPQIYWRNGGNSFFLLTLFALLLINPWASVWVGTPTVDLPTAIFFLVAVGYSVEFLRSGRPNLLYTAIAALILVSALRQANAILLVFLLIAFLYRRPSFVAGVTLSSLIRKSPAFLFLLFASGAVALLGSMVSRTGIRTGIPLYPLSSLGALNVDWRMPGGADAVARAKLQDLSVAWAVSDAREIPEVTATTLLQAAIREPVLQVTLALLAVSVLLTWLNKQPNNSSVATANVMAATVLLWSGCVAIVISAAWLARDPRYFWGPLLSLGLIPISVLLSSASRSLSSNKPRPINPISISLGVLATAYLLIFLQKGYLGTALIDPALASGNGLFGAQTAPAPIGKFVRTDSGLEVFAVTEGPSCYIEEQPCSYTVDKRLELRGETLREGFRIRQ